MPIQLTGLSGGFDASGVISQLVAIAKQPIDDIDAKKAKVDSASSTMSTFSSRLATLKANATSLADANGYASFASTSTDASVVTTANGAAQAGSYDVQVLQLANVQKLRGTTQASSSVALGMSGTMSITMGGNAAVQVTVAATDSLGDIATKLATSGVRISASVLYDGTNYRLSVQGLDTGSANAFSIAQTGFDLGLSNPANVYQQATNASLVVDGLSITRPTNQISGVIPGVTMAVTKAGTSSTVRVASDTTTLKTRIGSFVSAYNDIINAGHTATGYLGTKPSNTVLAGDPAIRRSLDSLARIVGSAVPGTTGAYNTLASVGVKLAQNGTLTFDGNAFDTAITKDADGVRKLFITDASLGATGVMKTIASAVDALITGASAPVKSRIDALAATSKRLDDSKAEKQKRVDSYEQQLRKQYSKLDEAMSRYNSMSSAVSSIGT